MVICALNKLRSEGHHSQLTEADKAPGVCARRGSFYVQYEVCEELGEGAFGKAVRVRRRRDGAMLVAKIMHEEGLSDRAREEVLLRS